MVHNAYCGVDIGGTTSSFLLRAAEDIKWFSGGFNFRELNIGAVEDILSVFTQDILSKHYVSGICFGIAGASNSNKNKILEQKLSKQFPKTEFLIKNDAEIAFADALLTEESGILLIQGTGSILYGKTKEKPLIRSGGWGYLFDEINGASSLGKHAIDVLIQILDGYKKDDVFLHAYESLFDADSLTEAIKQTYAEQSAARYLARFAEPLFLLWNEGHAESNRILLHFIHNIAKHISHMCLTHKFERPVKLYLSGGILKHQHKFRETLVSYLPQWIEVQNKEIIPERGALELISGN